ncbi:hypothetical protein FB567DRAFT_526720 [Paraphoma chrysanthemicola]|uniref:Major facilitator superfamily (MFS) profile domain-containing protein n=1 Tax=Paraphoma chrysanthemicola TaxID=798071 RepID=A0A8K0R4N6_9PLEO|nr:hypothetical protein FB567DRAFT_526720 [Paraphoma chrysanthemicola]
MTTTSEIMDELYETLVSSVKDSSSMEEQLSDIDPREPTGDYSFSGAKLHIINFALSLAVFLMALDMAILATAVPQITEKLQSTKKIGWYISVYTFSM